MVRWIWLAGWLAIAGWSCGIGGAESALPDAASPASGSRPPNISVRDLNGASHHLLSDEHRVVLLHFWATWCPHCRAEIPKLTEIYRRWGASDVTVLAISVDDDLSHLSRFVHANQLPYPVIAQSESPERIADQFHVWGIPTTLLIDRNGLIVARFEGESDLVDTVAKLLKTSHASGSLVSEVEP